MTEEFSPVSIGPFAALPIYVSHKRVRAARIDRIQQAPSCAVLHFSDGLRPITVGIDFMAKHRPEPGWYFVVYADGYQSASPPKAFQEGYTLLPPVPTSMSARRQS